MIPKNFLLISYRYLMSNKKDSAIDSMIKVCFAGICLATCALALVISIMKGFENSTYQTMKSIYPDLIIDAHHQEIDTIALDPILKEPAFHITHYTPEQTAQALLHHQEYDFSPTVIALKGIDPRQESLVTNLSEKLIKPEKKSLTDLIQDNHICIGYKLAELYHLQLDDKVQILYSNDEPEQLSLTFEQKPAIIKGIFKTGIQEFDSSFVYCSKEFFSKLFPEQGVSQIYVKLQDPSYEQSTIQLLTKRLNVDVYSWKGLYPALVSALKLETYAMGLILFLIVLIASMNIISLLFMYVTQKKKEIALLLCLGMTIKKIRIIFMSISIIIAIIATTIGLAIAYILGIMIERYPLIKLPEDAYFSSYLPIKLDPVVFCAIFIASICTCIAASIISTGNIKSIRIVQTLKE